MKKGLDQTIEEGIASRNAHMALSSLLTEEGDWAGAISHYQKALDHESMDEHSGNYLHLGRLYLENGQREEAEERFFKALSISKTRERDLYPILREYTAKGHYEELRGFHQRVSASFPLSARMHVQLARALIDMQQYDEAKPILIELNKKEPNADAYYWLFRIAQKENDLDAMELSIQKATVVDPRNSHYHLLFSQVLNRVNKLDRAEKEAGLAIDHVAKSSPGLFNHRASIRWKKEDYAGAAEDWQSGLTLQPRNAGLHARVAEAYLKLGDLPKATSHYQKALHFSPNNKTYQEKLEVLKAAVD